MNNRSESHDDFLQEGLTSYGRAIRTIKQFEDLVHSECSAILRGKVAALAASFGIAFTADSITTYPALVSAECVWLETGIHGKRDTDYLGLGLVWEKEDLHAFGDLYIGSSKDTNTLSDALGNGDLEPYYDRKEGGYLILYETLDKRTWEGMSDALSEVIKGWLSMAPQYSKIRKRLAPGR